MTEERLVELTGQLQRATLDEGSKSERPGIVLQTSTGETYAVRILEEPAFGPSVLDDLVGSTVTTKGIAVDATLLIHKLTVEK